MPNPDGTPTLSEILAGGSTAPHTIPQGTLQTINGYVYQYGNNGWYNTGVADPKGGAGGLSFDEQMALATATRHSTSSSSSVSSEDPAQFAAKLAQSADQFNQQMAETIRKNQYDESIQQQIQAFNAKKEQFAETQDNRRLAMEAQAQQQDAAIKQATLQQQRMQMEQQRQQVNAQMAFQAAQLNMQFQKDAQDRLAQSERDIANFAGNPTDYGKLAAYLTANNAFGGAATHLQGQNFTSPTSLQPLGSALQTAQTAQQQSTQTPYGYTPIAPQVSTGNPNQTVEFGSIPGAASPSTPTSGAVSAPGTNAQTANQNLLDAFGGTLPSFVTPFQNPGQAAASLPAAANGGVMDGAYIGDEKGAELHIPLGPGKALVINHDMLAKMKPDQVKSLKKMADGGVFSGGNVLDFNTTDPQQFLNQTVNKALSMTPWGGNGISGLPSPVFASSPGVSPLVTQLIGGIGQTAGLLPASEYARQADVLSPVGYTRLPIARQIPVGRTA